jgi:hypothetical protein
MVICLACTSLRGSLVLGNPVDTIYAGQLKPIGRFALHEDKGLEMISSAMHFKVGFTGKTVTLYVSIPDVNGHNYIQYALDGVYQKRLLVSGSSVEPLIINAKSNGKHILTIYKATEAHTGPIFISRIAANNVKALNIPQTPIIEFIGNSITCGAAADPSETPCQTGAYHDQHNAYMSYGARLARDMGVEYVLSSVSGIGIYRTWNRTGPAMPQVYDRIDFQNRSERMWDFVNFQPAVISIALGTNDLSNGDRKTPRVPFDSVTFVNEYVEFIKSLKLKHPSAKIALLSSPMVKGSERELLQRLLLDIRQKIDVGDSKGNGVAVFFFEPMNGRGCSGHPSIEDHAILASQLKPFFKGILNK